ncbi:PE-PPE domain-containing protein [Gordonia sp. N1V]|uniref:PE-PPE domain-containing protein n=1 Tax=Gordonia sp. N1V TaxID=3034163 RepID=UPI0023E1BB48|nr:PE-PPE domain-containing protein [Gordonia sp. N1V]MDF3284600.1 PE-PPE domain-containing protein [Gordonia sp. N1V]
MAALSLIAAAVAAGHGVNAGVNAADSASVTLSPANVRLASTVLTVAGNTSIVSTPMPQELRGELCHSPNTCQVVVYPSGAIGGAALQVGVTALTTDIATTPGKKIVFAYSQGGMIATTWLQDTAGSPSAPPASDLTFVLLGNPQRGLNGLAPTSGAGSATPTDTGYTVIDISREYDAESDWPNNPLNGLAVANAIAGYFLVHTDYTGVDVDDPNNLVQTVGGTTYVLVPTANLPLLEPLRMMGLNSVADQLNGPLKVIVDAGYSRSGYVTLSDDPAAQATINSVFGTVPTPSTSTDTTVQDAAAPRATAQTVLTPTSLPAPSSTSVGYRVKTSAAAALGTARRSTSTPADATQPGTAESPSTTATDTSSWNIDPTGPAASPGSGVSSSPTASGPTQSDSTGYVGRHRASDATSTDSGGVTGQSSSKGAA